MNQQWHLAILIGLLIGFAIGFCTAVQIYSKIEGKGMSKMEDGGAAFPYERTVSKMVDNYIYKGRIEVKENNTGMALRDWFAGQALTGIADNSRTGDYYNDNNFGNLAKIAYGLADAMIAERNKDV